MLSSRAMRFLLLLVICASLCLLLVTGGLLGRALLRWANSGEDTVVALTPAPQRTVRVNDGGQTHQLQTTRREPLPILTSAGIALGDKDRLWVNGAPANIESLSDWTVPALRIDIRRAVQLRINDDSAESVIMSAADTIGGALHEAGIKLGADDRASLPLETPLEGAIKLRITRAIKVAIRVDGREITARTQADSVAELLDELEIALGELDFTRPAADAEIAAGMEIDIVRVTIEEEVAREEVPPGEVQYRPDPNTPLDQSSVLQAAQPGIRETVTRVRYENGVEVSRETGEAQLVQEAQNEIRGYGTNALAIGTVAGREYWRKVCMYATSYHPASNSGNTQTATGATLRKGIVARKINSKALPLRGEVYVPGYGLGRVLDQGGGPASTEYWIDLGYSDHDYREWHEYVWVYLLWPAPPDAAPLLPAWRPVRTEVGNCG